MPVDDAEKFVIWMLQNFYISGETMMALQQKDFYATLDWYSRSHLAYVLKARPLKNMDILKAALEATQAGRSVSAQ